MTVLKVEKVLKKLGRVTDEIRHKTCVEEKEFSVGLISFSPGGDSDPKQMKLHGLTPVVSLNSSAESTEAFILLAYSAEAAAKAGRPRFSA
jgi:hypothetical protein